MKKSVFVVEYYYGESCPVAVFSTRELAEAWCEHQPEGEQHTIEEFELDPIFHD